MSTAKEPKSSAPRDDNMIMPEVSDDTKKRLSELTEKLSTKYFKQSFGELKSSESSVLTMLAERRSISRAMYEDADLEHSVGNRIADRVARIGGSWTFILVFLVFLVAWMILNSVILAGRHGEFDPYPYTALNLVLSMVAALQAPVIMMSQNRQAAHDRLDASHDYEINLKADLEILNLHEKFDELRTSKWEELVKVQQQQIDLLTQLLKASGKELKEATHK